jgi:prepilin-type N-terminal cleavage/methylation domain-containing protein
MMRVREYLAHLRSEEGVTLVEMMIVVSLLGVVLGFATKGLISMQNAANASSLRLQNLDEARVLMDQVSLDVRTATRLSATTSPFDVSGVPAPGFGHAAPYAGNTEVWFYANLTLTSGIANPCPDVVHLYVDTAATPFPVLKEQTLPANAGGTPPNCSYTGTYTTRFVGKYIVNTSTVPVFTYYYDDSNNLPTPFPSTSAPLSAANRLLVNAIGITISIRQSTNSYVPFTTLVNRVRLANVDYNPLPSPSP